MEEDKFIHQRSEVGMQMARTKRGFQPDTGWAWVVLTSAFLCNMIFDGIIYSISILFPEFKEFFQTSDSTTSWIVSTIGAVYHIVGEHLVREIYSACFFLNAEVDIHTSSLKTN